MSEFSDDEPPVNVSPIIAADEDAALEHLTLLFGRAHVGRIEVSCIHVDGGIRTRFFNLDQLEDAAAWAVLQNRAPGLNAYVGAALRDPMVFAGAAASDEDFLTTYALWADADNEQQVASARKAYRAAGLTPPFVVITGTVPTRRAQMWWPLEAPCADLALVRSATRGLAVALGTDTHVTTGKQLMRLAGTLAWPKPDKPGRVLERVEIFRPEAQQQFLIEQLTRAFPPVDALPAGEIADITIAPTGTLGLTTVIADGREGYGFRLVRANLRQFIGENGAAPTADELYRLVGPTFFAATDQTRAGRGPAFLKQKCVDALRAFASASIPGLRSLEEGVQTWAARQRGEATESDPDEDPEPADDGPFRASSLTGEAPERQWVVADWIVEGAVNSLYGDGGVGKTLIAQQLACSVSLGLPWLGLQTKRGAVLAVLCEDDKGELHRRHNAIKATYSAIGNRFDDVWLWPRVGAENELVTWDKDNKPTLAPFAQTLAQTVADCRPALLILDTLTDVYGGDEIQRRQVNYFIKTVLGRMIKDSPEPLTVLLLGHPSVAGKADGRGFSGSGAWNNAVRSRIYLTRPDDGQSDERILTRGKANYAASGDETAIRLFYEAGTLHAQQDAEDGDSALWSAKREALGAVRAAWDKGEPFAARKGHRRYLFTALPAELQRSGFGSQIIRQALRECVDDGQVFIGKSHEKRGYKTAESGSSD